VAPAVATDSYRLAAFLASTSLESKARARAPPAQPAPTSAATAAVAATKSPVRDHDHGHGHSHGASSDHSDPASPSSTGTGELLLQWGQNKRMRCRRDSASPSPQHRQAGGKIQRRSSSPAVDKLMPPPSAAPYTRGSNLRSVSSLPPRSGSGSGSGSSAGALPHPLRYGRRRLYSPHAYRLSSTSWRPPLGFLAPRSAFFSSAFTPATEPYSLACAVAVVLVRTWCRETRPAHADSRRFDLSG
jgi:hypothetical protein